MDCPKQDYWHKSSWNKDSQSTGTQKANKLLGCGSITHDPSLSASLWMTLGWKIMEKKMHNIYTTSSWKHMKSLQTGWEEIILDLPCNGIITTRKSICQCQVMSKTISTCARKLWPKNKTCTTDKQGPAPQQAPNKIYPRGDRNVSQLCMNNRWHNIDSTQCNSHWTSSTNYDNIEKHKSMLCCNKWGSCLKKQATWC